MDSPPDASDVLRAIYRDLTLAVDGADLVRNALQGFTRSMDATNPTAVLAVGKASFPMFAGLAGWLDTTGAHLRRGLIVAPAAQFPSDDALQKLPRGVTVMVADHPHPGDRSLAAGQTARMLIETLTPNDRLLVLLSGGGSSLLCAPAQGLSLADKRAAVTEVARNGATIAELNAVRKHLSAIKGGQLGLLCKAPATVFALSDVIGNDPGTIASGPFSPDASTHAQALALIERLAPTMPATVLRHLEQGARGQIQDTPKPGDHRLHHIDYHVIAGPERVREQACTGILSRGFKAGELARDTEAPVPALATVYVERAHREARTATGGHVLVGNGEPSIVVTGHGRGGRATHLALLVARGIAGLPGVAFLAAGTDDRDGNSHSNGAVVNGQTWHNAINAGLDPQRALDECNSEAPLAALGCLVQGPGTSNLLDLHLLVVEG